MPHPGETVKPGFPRVPTFSKDALQIALLWKASPYMALTYHTPSKIGIRLLAALTELEDEGILHKGDGEPGWSWTIKSRDLLATVPTISDKEARKNPLPMGVG